MRRIVFAVGLYSLALFIMCFVGTASAVTVTPYLNTEGKINFFVQGEIKKDDNEKFKKLIYQYREQSIDLDTVLLDSPGGELSAGIGMGLTIKSANMNTQVLRGSTCSSSCVSLLVAGRNITVDKKAEIWLHQISRDGKGLKSLTGILGEFYEFFGFPSELTRAMSTTPPEKAYRLSEKEKTLLERGYQSVITRWDMETDKKHLAMNQKVDPKVFSYFGLYYHLGLDGKRDDKKSLEYYREGVKNGDAESAYRLTLAYRNGWGVKKNADRVQEYFDQAVKYGHLLANIDLLIQYEESNNVMLVNKYIPLTEPGYPDLVRGAAFARIGIAYDKGWNGWVADKARAEENFYESAQLGNLGGQMYYAISLLTNNPTEDRATAGLIWMAIACSGSAPQSCEILEKLRDASKDQFAEVFSSD